MEPLRKMLALTLAVSASGMMQVPLALADQRTDARRNFRAGMQAIEQGQHAEGIAYLQAAYDILPHPNVLYNIGLAYLNAGDTANGVEYLERFKDTASSAEIAEVDAILARRRIEKEPAASVVTQAQAAPVASPAEPNSSVEAVETAAREVRRMADELGNEALLRQAEELETVSKTLRESAEARVSVAPVEPVKEAPAVSPETPERVQQEQHKREGVYEEEVVSASRFAQSPLDAPNATAIITAQDIQMTGLTNITDLLRRVAGVEVSQMSPSHAEVSIRGLNRRQSNKVLMLIDGRPARLDFVASSWWNQSPIPVEQIERIEIIRGPASSLYGADAFSGVINIVTKAAGQGGNFVSGQYGTDNTARSAAGFSGKDGKLAYRMGFVYVQTDNAVRAVGKERKDVYAISEIPNTAMKTAAVNAEMRYDLAKNTDLTVGGHLHVGGNTITGSARLGELAIANDSLRYKAYTTLALPHGFRVSSWYDVVQGGSGTSYSTPGAIDVYGGNQRSDIADVDFSWSGRVSLFVPHNLTLGGGYRYKHVEWDWMPRDREQHHFSGYIQDVVELTRKLKLQLGARVDRHPLLNGAQFSPRGSLVYRFLADQSLRLGIGRAFRGPSFLESYSRVPYATPLRGVTAFGEGNTRLDPEGIVSYELGYQNQASDYFSLEANVYFNTVKDAIQFIDNTAFTLRDFHERNGLAAYDPTLAAYPVSVLRYSNERATFRQLGGELGARFFPVDGLDIYTNYSIHHTAPMDKSKIDPVRAKEQQTSLHKVNAGVQYRARFGLDTSVEVSWLSNQLWIDEVTDLESGGVRFQTFKQPSFTMLNARVGYRFWNDKLDLGVVGTNLVSRDLRQHPYGQPLDTRVLGTAKLRF